MTDLHSKMDKLRKIYLRKLIGGRARYHDEVYEIIEILEDGPAMVLQSLGEHTSIQADQHGEAHRRVPETVTVRLPLTDSGTVDMGAIDLDLLDISMGDAGVIER